MQETWTLHSRLSSVGNGIPLKCIERESANYSPECSNAYNVTNSSPASAITNSSPEDIEGFDDEDFEDFFFFFESSEL